MTLLASTRMSVFSTPLIIHQRAQGSSDVFLMSFDGTELKSVKLG
jgi:hypothetical protein